MSYSQNVACERANKNFRYSWMYFIVAGCISIYYLGVFLWISSHNNWQYDDKFILSFIEKNGIAHGLMIGFLILSLISLIIFILLFFFCLINSIRILFASKDVNSGTKFWAFVCLFFLLLTLAELIIAHAFGYVQNNKIVSIIMNWFNLLGPFLLLLSTGFCKMCANKK